VAGETVGFLNVDGTRSGQFGPADARRLQAFADHAAAAIQNAQLYRDQLNYAERLEERVHERTEQLQAQYARLEAILSSASDGIVVSNASGKILEANPVAETWMTSALSPKDAIQLQETVRDLACRVEERPEAVLELTGLDLELRASPILGAEGEEAAAVVAIHDVSHLKALDRMKTRFVSNVSHELRTPITTIKLYSELMRRQPERWEEYLAILTQEADRQARLVEDILGISRIDAGRLDLEPRRIRLNKLTEVVTVNYRALAQESGLTLEHQPIETEPMVLVDPVRMMQVLSNLVGNAIRYTAKGGKVVILTGEDELEDRVWATATVTDTGMGIPQEELPHIFERFFRGEGPRRMQVSGTGLGLAIAKEIVELHGGQVTVESQKDEGSAFTVWLPLTNQYS
jgi:signal transduction histidine kinase